MNDDNKNRHNENGSNNYTNKNENDQDNNNVPTYNNNPFNGNQNQFDMNSFFQKMSEMFDRNEKTVSDLAKKVSSLESELNDYKSNEPAPDPNDYKVEASKPAIEIGGDQDDGSLSCLGMDFNLKRNGKNCFLHVDSISLTKLYEESKTFWVYGIEKNIRTEYTAQDGKPRAAILIKLNPNDPKYLKVITSSREIIQIMDELEELAKTNNKTYPRKVTLKKLVFGGYTLV